MSDPIDRDPPRLKREVGPVANLLRRADEEFRENLDEANAFRRLEGVRRRRSALSFGVSAVAVAGIALFAARHQREPEPSLFELRAEAPRKAAPVSSEPETRPALPQPLEARHTTPRSVASFAAAPAAPPPTEADCRRWSSSGKAERAQECFRTLARTTSGVQAEVALYEAARLSAEALKEPVRAIALLDEHATRYPASSLRGEVRWLKIRCLSQAGRSEAALSESETLLGSPEGRALTQELHLLRGHIYRDQRKDCVNAVSEFVALTGSPGAAGDDAEFNRAGCLEALGRVDDAVTAYERYLERSNVARASEARARLTMLRP